MLKIVSEDAESVARSAELAKQLGVADDHTADNGQLVLFVSREGLSIATVNDTDRRVRINFNTGKNAHRRKFGGGVKQAIAKAVGLNKNKSLKIIDATGGLARDAFVLASLGAELCIMEQSNVLSLLIEDALQSGRQFPDTAEITQRMRVYHCNATDALASPRFLKVADVVYMDPMYPERRKSAAVKKDMQLLHLLAGPDQGAENLLQAAIIAARKRVVVKRPVKAAPLSTYRLAGDVRSKNTRYDIYTPVSQESQCSVAGKR